MKQPDARHPITIAPSPHRIRVRFGGEIIADTTRALTMREAAYPPVHYIPREDARMDLLVRTPHASFCSYKGDCGYFSIEAGGGVAENAVWTYEAPYPAVGAIAGYLAFYPSRVAAIEEG